MCQQEHEPTAQQRGPDDGCSRRAFVGAAASGVTLAGSGLLPAASEAAASDKGNMLWSRITAERFPQIVEEVVGVCLLPWGCFERHGPHLPVGTDTILAEAVAVRAAQIEPAVVFPALCFGQIAGARHCPGTVSLGHELLFHLLVATLDEIGRNGFAKIVIVNGHGGNNGLLDDLLFSLLQQRRSYVAYAAQIGVAEEDRQQWQQMCPTPGEHAGAGETSLMMAVLPEMVHLEQCKDVADSEPRHALKHLHGLRNSFWWYADYPTQLAGDPRSATAEKGKFYLGSCARALARQIAQVKADDVSAKLAREFYAAAERGGLPRKAHR